MNDSSATTERIRHGRITVLGQPRAVPPRRIHDPGSLVTSVAMLRGHRRLREVAGSEHVTAAVWRNLTIVAVAALAALVLGAATLRRRTP